MGEVIDLQQARLRRIASFAFKGWDGKFKEEFSHITALKDLGNETIRFFLADTPQGLQIIQILVARAIYSSELVKHGFDRLDIKAKRRIIDISIFIMDQLRFEAMFRLGWVEEFPARSIPIVELIVNFYSRYEWMQYETPAISVSHELYKNYAKTYDADKKSFVRKLIPSMIKIFCEPATINDKGAPEL